MPEPDHIRRDIVEDIWASVVPYEMKKVSVLQEDKVKADSLITKDGTIADLAFVFTGENSFEADNSRVLPRDFAPLLAHKNYEWSTIAPFGKTEYFRIIIVVANLVRTSSDSRPNIGRILEECYRAGVLEQPVALDPPHYLEHILLAVAAAFSVNVILPYPYALDDYYIYSRYGPIASMLTSRNSLGEALGIHISDLLHVFHGSVPEARRL